MSTLKKPAAFAEAAAPHPLSLAGRRLVAGLLTAASTALARFAAAVEPLPAPVVQDLSEPRLEFYAEAGAPEGALYVDGELVGWLRGVHRL